MNRKIRRSVEQLSDILKKEVINLLYSYDKKATGDLIKSINVNYDVNINNRIIYLKVSSKYYMKFIIYGRRPGAKMPPVDKIKRWVEIKNIDKKFNLSSDKVSWIISKSIQKKGIKPINIIKKAYYNFINKKSFDKRIKDISYYYIEIITNSILEKK